MSNFYFLWVLWEQNKDALLSLPTPVKSAIVLAIVITLISSIANKLWRVLKLVLIILAVYMLLSYAGVI